MARNPKATEIKKQDDETIIKNHPCTLLKTPPRVCNSCARYKNNTCTYNFIEYNPIEAEEQYKKLKSISNRVLNDKSQNDKAIKVLEGYLKKNQPIDHALHTLNFKKIAKPVSRSKFYYWVENNYIDYDVKEIKRLKKSEELEKINQSKIDRLEGREYTKFLDYVSKNPKAQICEMDLVCGPRGENGYILSLFFPSIQFYLAYKLEYKTPFEVIEKLDYLEKILTFKVFRKMFPIILTDRGSEFLKYDEIEKSKTNKIRRCRIFYCDGGKPNQKPNVENVHTILRRVIKKGTSLKDITQEDLSEIISNMNSLKKKSFGFRTPNQMFKEIFGTLVFNKLGLIDYEPEDVVL